MIRDKFNNLLFIGFDGIICVLPPKIARPKRPRIKMDSKPLRRSYFFMHTVRIMRKRFPKTLELLIKKAKIPFYWDGGELKIGIPKDLKFML